jgi:hypothetical protein
LYTFAEESLIKFAERVEEDIPECCMFVDIENSAPSYCLGPLSEETGIISTSRTGDVSKLEWGIGSYSESENSCFLTSEESERVKLGSFRERVIAAFDYV